MKRSNLLHVRVTADHISQGWRGDCGLCPVALAAGEVLPANKGCRVGTQNITIYKNGEYQGTKYPLPQIAVDFIRKFDFHDPVQPFEFDVDLDAVPEP